MSTGKLSSLRHVYPPQQHGLGMTPRGTSTGEVYSSKAQSTSPAPLAPPMMTPRGTSSSLGMGGGYPLPPSHPHYKQQQHAGAEGGGGGGGEENRDPSPPTTSSPGRMLQQAQSNADVVQLKEENEMLREIETQFWALLSEREDLQQELTTLREQANQELTAAAAKASIEPQPLPVGEDGAILFSLREENDSLRGALEECIGLLVVKDQGGDVLQQQGTVPAFLSWLQLQQDRLSTKRVVDAVLERELQKSGLVSGADNMQAISLSPVRGRSAGGEATTTETANPSAWDAERNALIAEMNALRKENRELKDELDRTDNSRLQALDDVASLQRQVEMLTQNMSELRTAYAQARARADQSTDHRDAIAALQQELSDRTEEVAELKMHIAQIKQLQAVGAASLAADAARIRSEFAQRDRSESHPRSDSPMAVS